MIAIRTAVIICSIALCIGCTETGAPVTVDQKAASKPSEPAAPMESPGSGLLTEGASPSNVPDLDETVPTSLRFEDRHEQAGIRFIFRNGAEADRKLMPEATSGGAGWLDYDADGWTDLCCIQGGEAWQSQWDGQPADEIYRNLGEGTFRNVSRECRLSDRAFGHGVSVADFNDDGFDDLYIANVGPDVLHLNMGDGTFLDVTAESGIANTLWAASSAWMDLDGDGDLDLYVCNYVDYDPLDPILCVDAQGNPGTCHPRDVGPVPNRCYINQGNGQFTEEADQRGLNGPGSKSLGVVIADFNGDSKPDVYVCNDTTANHFFVNQGAGMFTEEALSMGCAASGLGQFQASMGVACGDYDRNGYPDLYLTHFTQDSNTLYQNLAGTGFSDATRPTNLHRPTLPLLGFGTVMEDLNADGYQDLLIANGHIDDWRELTGDDWYMRPQLFRFDGARWQECGPQAGPYFSGAYLGRAIATADYDQNGSLDAFIVNQNAPGGLLCNTSELGNWIQVRLVGTQSNRRGIGARVRFTYGGIKQTSQLVGGTSYCAAHQPLVSFGVGKPSATATATLEVQWPSGRQQTLHNVQLNSQLTIHERDAGRP